MQDHLLHHETKPLVSVCVQTYRHAAFIEQCLNSILEQKTSFPFEIILGEDESDDGTREICVRMAESHPDKIRLFLRSRKDVIYIDGKATGRYNFKANVAAASGKYIAMCEGDDYWTDELKLQKQVDFLEQNPDYSICFHKVQILKSGRLCDDYITKVPGSESGITDLAKGNYIHTPSVMFKSGLSFPVWFDEVLAGDYALHMLNALRGKIYCINEVMAVYRIHQGGMWSEQDESGNQLKWLRMLNTMSANFTGEVKSALDRQRLNWAMHLYEKGFHSEVLPVISEQTEQLISLLREKEKELNGIISQPENLEQRVSGTFMVKALLLKIKGIMAKR